MIWDRGVYSWLSLSKKFNKVYYKWQRKPEKLQIVRTWACPRFISVVCGKALYAYIASGDKLTFYFPVQAIFCSLDIRKFKQNVINKAYCAVTFLLTINRARHINTYALIMTCCSICYNGSNMQHVSSYNMSLCAKTLSTKAKYNSCIIYTRRQWALHRTPGRAFSACMNNLLDASTRNRAHKVLTSLNQHA
jgi:hypothetical protein